MEHTTCRFYNLTHQRVKTTQMETPRCIKPSKLPMQGIQLRPANLRNNATRIKTPAMIYESINGKSHVVWFTVMLMTLIAKRGLQFNPTESQSRCWPCVNGHNRRKADFWKVQRSLSIRKLPLDCSKMTCQKKRLL